jgi:hypothetical protein
VLEGIHVVWASLLEECLEVVCRWLHLMLAATYGDRDTPYTGATLFLVVIAIVVEHDYDPLETLLASLLATPGALFGVLDSDIERHPLPLILVASLLLGAGRSLVASSPVAYRASALRSSLVAYLKRSVGACWWS